MKGPRGERIAIAPNPNLIRELASSNRHRIVVCAQKILPRRARRGDFFLDLLLGVFTDRREGERRLHVFLRGEAFVRSR